MLILLFMSSLSPVRAEAPEAWQKLSTLAAGKQHHSGVYVLEEGESSLLARAWLTKNALKQIDVQYFIWSTDNIGILGGEMLLSAAERGVTVRVIVDDLLIDAEDHTLLSLAAHPNVSIRIYNPKHIVGTSFLDRLWNIGTDFRNINQRMHNKLVVYDGLLAITGGRNMADEYYDYDTAYNFRDRDVLLAGGKALKQMQSSFQQFWDSQLSVPVETLLKDEKLSLETGKIKQHQLDLHAYARDPKNFSPEVKKMLADMDKDFAQISNEMKWSNVEFIGDIPGKNDGSAGLGGGGIITDKLLNLVKGAQKEILIQTPYLVMPEGGLQLFKELTQKGIDIHILTNSLASTDNLQAHSGYHKQRQSLLDAGIVIHESRPNPAIEKALIKRFEKLKKDAPVFAIHAKTMVIDREKLFIGTFNLDPRSANLNTEVGALVHDAPLATQVGLQIKNEMAPENSWNVNTEDADKYASWFKRLQLWFWKLFPLDPIL